MKLSHIYLYLLLVSFAFGTTPSGIPKKLELEDIWEKATTVIHGRITSQRIINLRETKVVETILEPKRSWKGFTAPALKEKNEVVFIQIAYPISGSRFYDFELDVDYAVFLSDTPESYDGYLVYAMPINIPANHLEQLFENSSSDQPTGDGYKMKEKWKLRQFLKSRDCITKESIQTQ